MSTDYVLGIMCAIVAGTMNALGAILQKSAINRIISRAQTGSFTASFVRNPIWVMGLVVSIGFGTIFNMSAQARIGPALVPALTASGMILLAIGSAKMLNEKLKPSEWLGIISLVIGIASLGFSRLQIPRSEVDLLDHATQFRIGAFSVALVFCWWLSWVIAQRVKKLSRGLLLAISAGLPFCLSNLWILPLLMTIGLVFSGSAQRVQVIIFILACLTLVITNMLGIRQTQESYRFAPANKAQPLQQVPTQIAPILIYLFVFQRSITGFAIMLVPVGVTLILTGGFLLGNRRADIKSPDSSQDQSSNE
jgi:multidrug transporter EmrE-like cation transporter